MTSPLHSPPFRTTGMATASLWFLFISLGGTASRTTWLPPVLVPVPDPRQGYYVPVSLLRRVHIEDIVAASPVPVPLLRRVHVKAVVASLVHLPRWFHVEDVAAASLVPVPPWTLLGHACLPWRPPGALQGSHLPPSGHPPDPLLSPHIWFSPLLPVRLTDFCPVGCFVLVQWFC